MSPRRNELAEKAVIILATAWVVLCGAGASAFVIVSSSSTPGQTLGAFASGCVVAAILLWLVRDRNPAIPRGGIFAWFRRPKTTTVHYELRVRKTTRDPNVPPPQPPTPERIRELSEEGAGTWVPSRDPKKHREQK